MEGCLWGWGEDLGYLYMSVLQAHQAPILLRVRGDNDAERSSSPLLSFRCGQQSRRGGTGYSLQTGSSTLIDSMPEKTREMGEMGGLQTQYELCI